MVSRQLNSLGRQVRRLAYASEAGTLSDRHLLERFVLQADEGAFEALVRRHGPMVLGVCRRVLHDDHAAEDAFQATFLVLLRRIDSIAQPDLLGNWLYGVACRTAKEVRTRSARRRAREQLVAQQRPDAEEPAGWDDVRPVLDEELSRLPDKYRVPVVLCDLESRSRKEVAEQIGCPEGTLSSRLARARDLLRVRLLRRGLVLSTGALALGLAPRALAVPVPLVSSTVRAVLAGSTAEAVAAGLISAPVVSLVEGVLPAMFVSKLKLFAGAVLALGVVGAGTGYWTQTAQADLPALAAQEREKPAEGNREGEKKEAPTVRGVVKAVDAARNTVTVTVRLEGEVADHTVPVPKDARIVLLKKEQAGLSDLQPQMQVQVQLTADQKAVVAIREVAADAERREVRRDGEERGTINGIARGVDAERNTITITIARDGQEPMQQAFALAKDVRVLVGEREGGKLADVTPGMRVQLQLAENKREVVVVRGFSGTERRDRPQGIPATFKAVDAASTQLTIIQRGDGDREVERTLGLAKELRVSVGAKESATTADLKPGMKLLLTLGGDRRTIVAIREAGVEVARPAERERPAERPAERERQGVNGMLKAVDASKGTVTLAIKTEEVGEVELTLAVQKEARIATAEKERATLGDLKPGKVAVILSEDKKTVLAIKEVR